MVILGRDPVISPLPIPLWTIHLLKSGTFGLDGELIIALIVNFRSPKQLCNED